MSVKQQITYFFRQIANKLFFKKPTKSNGSHNQFDTEFEESQNGIKNEKLFQIIKSPTSELMRDKIGKLVRSTMPDILTSELISELEVNKLTKDEYSKMIFDMNYPVLKLVDENMSIKDNRTVGVYTRYYADPHIYKGKQYLISSEWYDRNQEYYIKWLKRKILKN